MEKITAWVMTHKLLSAVIVLVAVFAIFGDGAATVTQFIDK